MGIDLLSAKQQEKLESGIPRWLEGWLPPNRLSLWATKSTSKKKTESDIFERSNLFQYIHCKWCVLYILLCSLKCMNASSESMYLTEPLSAFVGFGSLQGSLTVGSQTYLIQGHAWGTISDVSQYPDQSDTRFGIGNKDNSTFSLKHQPSSLHLAWKKSPTNMNKFLQKMSWNIFCSSIFNHQKFIGKLPR